MSETLALARRLIARPSVTPDDAGCQELLAERLGAMGFAVERMPFGAVSNLWAALGRDGPLLVFAGHTDVVPPGPAGAWRFDPFAPVERDGWLYGRGSADMKGSLAAMVTAAARFLASGARPRCRLGFLITSDEEGPAVDGTRRVVETLSARGVGIDYCLVGEPSCRRRLGDTIKIGRRGSLNGELTVRGVKRHVAYPERGGNPIHRAAPALAALAAERWDEGNASFPPTSFQISNVNAGVGAHNVVPGILEARFNFRYSTESTAETLRERTEEILRRSGADFELRWLHSGRPFLTERTEFIGTVSAAVEAVAGAAPERSTDGGTSDGRFIAPTGAQVVEFGPVNATIHQVDERVRIADLDRLSRIYEEVLERAA